jgi:hypothetical protein
VLITGGPGGTSSTLIRTPIFHAISVSGSRTVLAITWLGRFLSPLGTRFTCRSATFGPCRMK